MLPLARWWTAWRERAALRRRPIPDRLWRRTLRDHPFLTHLSEVDQARLRRLCSLFLDRKEFTGVRGFRIRDEVAVAVAAQACLPVLNLSLDLYDGVVGIVMHADQVVAQRESLGEDGVVHHYDEVLSGEAMDGGPVMLSWRDVAHAGALDEPAYNVVIHEFVHVLDMRDGVADGMPQLANAPLQRQWITVMEAAYTRFVAQVDAGAPTLLDPYAATAPAEFFAVAAEVFFVTPRALRDEWPDVYALLAGYFRQDPALTSRA